MGRIQSVAQAIDGSNDFDIDGIPVHHLIVDERFYVDVAGISYWERNMKKEAGF